MAQVLTFIAGVVLGGLVSWLIAHRYYLKAATDQRDEIERLQNALRPRTTLQDFEDYLLRHTWHEANIDGVETWICDADNTFQIRRGDRLREFNERWTTVYPNSHSGAAYPVYLVIGNNVIRQLTFISMDGGRIFVPMASLRPTEDEGVEYFWNANSLEVRVCRIIGSYYIYENLEGVARTSRVTLVEE